MYRRVIRGDSYVRLHVRFALISVAFALTACSDGEARPTAAAQDWAYSECFAQEAKDQLRALDSLLFEGNYREAEARAADAIAIVEETCQKVYQAFDIADCDDIGDPGAEFVSITKDECFDARFRYSRMEDETK